MNGMPYLLLADGTDQVSEIARTFGVSWPQLISQVISFLIVCFMLQRFAYRPVLKMLAERRENIADGLAAADKHREQLKQAEQERTRILDEAQQQAEQMMAEAKAAASEIRQQKIAEATADADRIRIQANEQTERDRQQMQRELQNDVGMLVVKTAASVTRHVMTPDDEERLVAEAAAVLEQH